jgi:uncharacterized protein
MDHVTGSILYSLVTCPQRVALDFFGDPSKRISPFVQLLWDRGTIFERETIAALKTPFLDLSRFKGEEKERLTLEVRNGEPLIYSGRISSGDLLGIPDLHLLPYDPCCDKRLLWRRRRSQGALQAESGFPLIEKSIERQ